MKLARRRRGRRRRNPAGQTAKEIAAVVGGGFVGSWIGYFLGTAVTGSKMLGAPYGYAGTLIGATAGHFLVK